MNIFHFYKKGMLLIFIFLSFLSSCKKKDNSEVANNGVYIVGTQAINTSYTSSTSKAIFWKDGVAFYLGDTTKASAANSIFVTNDAVYIAGWESGKATLWKNGVVTYISNIINGSEAVQVEVVNNKIYVLFNEHNSTTNQNNIKLWVDGVVTSVGNTSLSSLGNALFVNNNDVYIAGLEHDFSLNVSRAMLWKNNIPTVLSNSINGSHIAQALSVFVSNNNIYVSGYQLGNTNIAKLWKNGVETNITDGTANAFLTSVYVEGNDVYAIGTEDNAYGHNIAAIWKNGNKTNLVGLNEVSSANQVLKKGDDVYVVGNNGDPKVWKNGIASSLPFTRYPITMAVYASSIFVK